MKVCVIGAGAVGGLIASRLVRDAQANNTVSVLARGATLKKLQADGLQCFEKTADNPDSWNQTTVELVASDDAQKLGEQDLVIIAVKYNGMDTVARQIQPLLGEQTVVLSAMNGVPWWFGHGQQGALGGLSLNAVDRDGEISRAIAPNRVIGCVVHLAASVREPGVIQLNMGNRLVIGEPDGSFSARLDDVASLLSNAGFEVQVSQAIHYDLWYKLWGNMTVNP